jgi:hypothetical protein
MSGETPGFALDCPLCGDSVFVREVNGTWGESDAEHCESCGSDLRISFEEDDDGDIAATPYVYEHAGSVVARLRAEISAALDLLAVIHRDGGHHEVKHGLVRSCKAGEAVVIGLRAEVECLKSELADETGALDEASRHAMELSDEVERLTGALPADKVADYIRESIVKAGQACLDGAPGQLDAAGCCVSASCVPAHRAEEVLDAYDDARAEVARLRTEVELHREDLRVAAGECLVALPEPGSDMARMMRANRLLRVEGERLTRERDDLADEHAAAIAHRNAADRRAEASGREACSALAETEELRLQLMQEAQATEATERERDAATFAAENAQRSERRILDVLEQVKAERGAATERAETAERERDAWMFGAKSGQWRKLLEHGPERDDLNKWGESRAERAAWDAVLAEGSPTTAGGFDAIIGKLPSDETDEEFISLATADDGGSPTTGATEDDECPECDGEGVSGIDLGKHEEHCPDFRTEITDDEATRCLSCKATLPPCPACADYSPGRKRPSDGAATTAATEDDPAACSLCGVALTLVGNSTATVCGDCLTDEAHVTAATTGGERRCPVCGRDDGTHKLSCPRGEP